MYYNNSVLTHICKKKRGRKTAHPQNFPPEDCPNKFYPWLDLLLEFGLG